MERMNGQHWTFDDEKLEAYVLMNLNSQEYSELEDHLKQCKLCQQRVKEERELIADIREYGRKKLKERIKTQLSQVQEKKVNWIHLVSIAASVLVILSVAFLIKWFLNLDGQKTNKREIVLLEQTEHQPNAVWIIGKLIEIKGKPNKVGKTLSEDKLALRKTESTPPIADREKDSGPSLAENENIIQKHTTKNILVRQGNLNELPDSLKLDDHSKIRTRLEHTEAGILLTFYTNTIKDSSVEKVLFVGEDSIIVKFSEKIIAYKIPCEFMKGM